MVDLTLEIIGDRQVIRNLELLPEAVKQVIKMRIDSWAEQTAGVVTTNIEERLNTKTGRLAGGVEYETRQEGMTTQARIWIDAKKVPYAAAQEKGAIIPPHLIVPKKARILSFINSFGDKIGATRVNHPGATLRAVNFMSDAYRQQSSKLSTEIKKALVNGIRERMRSGGSS